MTREREYATLVAFDKGVITCVNKDGQIGQFLQRGVGKMTENQKLRAIQLGILTPNYKNYLEFPRWMSLEIEDKCQGRVTVGFPIGLISNRDEYKGVRKNTRR